MTELFLEILKMSLLASLFAGAVMMVRFMFRKAPKWIFVALWGVVALRLLLPFSLESKMSIVPQNLASGQVITKIQDAYVGPVDIIYENDPSYWDVLQTGRQPIRSEQGDYIVTQKNSAEAPKTFGQTVLPVLGWVWLAGAVLMLTYAMVSYLLLKGKMAVATQLQENVWQCEAADMPFVLGVFRPKIYLPYQLTSEDAAYVIAHEQAHIARRDHWWKPLGFALLSMHWFNPVLWVSYILLCRDIEAACDEKVIGPMDKEYMRAYSTALLNCSVRRRRIAACPLAFGETGVKERIRRVMNYKKPAFWIVLAAVVAAAVLIVCFCTNPLRKDVPPSTDAIEATEPSATENQGNTSVPDDTDAVIIDNMYSSYIELIYYADAENAIRIEDKAECAKLVAMLREIKGRKAESTVGYSGAPFTLAVYQVGQAEPIKFTVWDKTRFSSSANRDRDGNEFFIDGDLTELYNYLEEHYPVSIYYPDGESWSEKLTPDLSGPASQYVQLDDSRTVTYRQNYQKEDTTVWIYLPKFLPFSDDAVACQAAIETDLKGELDGIARAVAEKNGSMTMYITFEAYLNGDILSVVIKSESAYGSIAYYTYNFDVTTGKRLDKAALVEKLQITNYDQLLKQGIEVWYQNKYGDFVSGDKKNETLIERLNSTLQPANLDKVDLYVDGGGKLVADVYAYGLAGAAGYNELIPLT